MAALSDILAALGCRNVQTFIQSGNVVFDLPEADLGGLADQVSDRIRDQFGFRPATILRSRNEMVEIVNLNPFLRSGCDPDLLHLVFLPEEPAPDIVAKLDLLDVAPDVIAPSGREIYLLLPNGVSQANVTAKNFYSKIGIHTARNWRTVTKLLALMIG